ncbi:MAG: PqqD family protein [Myxococcales bacterium]|nr:PqqD family protein [Myxococcales bacterium]MCB9522831.1 PqqD family protein [Myxococcales bacterium]
MAIVVPGRRVASRVIEGQALLLDPRVDELQRLNPVGTFVWQLVTERKHTRAAMLARVIEEFEVDRAQAAADLDEFLGELEARGLVATTG